MVTRHFRRALTNLHEVEKLDDSRDKLFEYYYVSRQFERVADHAEKVAQFALDPDATIPLDFAERIETLSAQSRQIVDAAADVILADADIEGAQTALNSLDELRTALDEFDRELYAHDDPGEAYVVGLLLDSIRRTGEYGANVAGVAIQQVARETSTHE
jgi:phosphate uptake regulator